MLTMQETRRRSPSGGPAPAIRVWRKGSLDTRQAIEKARNAVSAARGDGEPLGGGNTRPKAAESAQGPARDADEVAGLKARIVELEAELGRMSEDMTAARILSLTSEALGKELMAEAATSRERIEDLESQIENANRELRERPTIQIRPRKDRIRELEAELEVTNLRWEVEAERRVNEALRGRVARFSGGSY